LLVQWNDNLREGYGGLTTLVHISIKSNGNQNNQSLRYDELGVDPISREYG